MAQRRLTRRRNGRVLFLYAAPLWSYCVVASACAREGSTSCSNGLLCPPGLVCAESAGLCVSRAQLQACDGLDDGSDCVSSGMSGGRCQQGICVTAGCGDGRAVDPEQCDGEDLRGQDCASAGYYEGTLGCTPLCTLDVTECRGRCGDGIVQRDRREACDTSAPPTDERTCLDYGFDMGLLSVACSNTCQVVPTGCIRIGWNVIEGPGSGTSDLSAVWAYSEPLSPRSGPPQAPSAFVANGLGQVFGYRAQTWGGALNAGSSTEILGLWGYWGFGTWALYASLADGSVSTFDGMDWRVTQLGHLGAITAVGGTDLANVWAVGAGSQIFRRADEGWTRMEIQDVGQRTVNAKSIWMSSPSDVWVTGEAGRMLHFDGTLLRLWEIGMGDDVESIWGNGRGDLFAVGESGLTLRCSLKAGTCESDSAWAVERMGVDDLRSVSGISARSVFSVGRNGRILHFDGFRWEPLDSDVEVDLAAVSMAPDATGMAVGKSGTVLLYPGLHWSQPVSTGPGHTLNGIWGASPGNIFVVGDGGVALRYDGLSWLPTPTSTDEDLEDVWGTSENDVFAVGSHGTILRYDGESWSPVPLSLAPPATGSFRGVWGTDGVVYAVGDNGMIIRFAEPWEPFMAWTWTEEPSGTTAQLNAVWGRSSQDVYAVGNLGTVLHFDGEQWSEILHGLTTNDLEAIWGSQQDVFAVGSAGTILSADASGWFLTPPVTTARLMDVTGIAPFNPADRMVPREVLAVGENGTYLHRSGDSWMPTRTGATTTLSGVWLSPTGSPAVLIGEEDGLVLRLIRPFMQ